MEFKPEQFSNKIMQSQEARKKLEGLYSVWRGGDISIILDQVIPAKTLIKNVPILITKEQLPPIPMNRGALGILSHSVRSFFAQSGIDIKFSAYDISEEEMKKIEKGEPAIIPIHVYNNGERGVMLHGRVMRFFWMDFTKRLQGEKLREAMGTKVSITGKEGVDWVLDDVPEMMDDVQKDAYKQVDIKINLTDKKYYIPQSPEPVNINSRKDLSAVHVPIPKELEDKLDFKIGETPYIELSDNVMGVIETGGYDGGSRHIASPLIDPGFSGPIRTEITGEQNFIHLSIFPIE